MPITAERFERATGRPPKDDDLERCNCDRAGEYMHRSCGWCVECEGPVFQCGHSLPLPPICEICDQHPSGCNCTEPQLRSSPRTTPEPS